MLLGLLVSLTYLGDAARCQQVSNDKPMSKADKQKIYAGLLEKFFLRSGVSADVFIYEGRLTISMPTDKATVYLLITKGNLLKHAYDLGFKGLDFTQDYGQQYRFSFANGIPRCDAVRKICL